MAGFKFCHGHLTGRIVMLEGSLKTLKALNEVVYLQAKKVTEEDDEDGITLIGLVRLVQEAHENLSETLQELREIADDALEKEREARAAAKAQGKEG
ncbi:MAG TPA: hypothetical protein VGX03_21140 [Candidatus Binatia bacterium]|jgi:hypothetical protein|nr:hypothetical protein [Candidatus Binatia bacterium]